MSQNINIIYKVDKSQIDSSNASVEKAKQLTDQLTASTQKFAQQGAKNNAQFQGTIEGVRLRMQQLRAQIDLTNQSDKKRLNDLITQYKAAEKQLNSYTAALKNNSAESKNAASSTDKMVQSFGNLYSALKLIIGAQIAKQFVEITIEAAALAGKVEGIERAFKRAFPNGTLLLNDLRKATHGTVADVELMQRTLQAFNLGVDVQKLPQLFEFATVRAQQTGESVDYLVDSIVRGIGRKSPLILDNLGLSAIRLKEQFNGASLASQSIGDVTEAVAKIAQEELAKMGGYVETSAQKVDRLKVSWEGLKEGISKLITGEGGLIDFFQDYVDTFKDFIEVQNKGITVSELYRRRRVEEAAQIGVNLLKEKEFTDSKEQNLKITKEVIAEKIHELLQLQEEGKQLDENLKALKAVMVMRTSEREERRKAITDSAKQNKNSRDVLIEEIKLLKELQAQLNIDSEATDKQSDSLQTMEDKLKDIKDQIQTLDGISTDAGKRRATQLQNEANALQDQIDLINSIINKEELLRKQREKIKNDTIRTPKSATDDLAGDSNQKITLSPDVEIVPASVTIPTDFWDDIEEMFSENWRGITDEAISIQTNALTGLVDAELNAYNQRIVNAENYYDNQTKLAGDNDRAKAQIEERRQRQLDAMRREQFRKEKEAAKQKALINAAGAAARAFVDYEYPYSLVVAALAAAAALVEVNNINKAQPGFKDGVIDLKGPGTTKSDSIPAMLSRRESVMTAEETISSGRTLRMIRAKKLNDKILDRIVNKANQNGRGVMFDDSRLLAATNKVAKAAAGNDIIRKGHIIYEAQKEGENLTRYVRSKIINS